MSIGVGERALRFRIRQNLLQRVPAQLVLLAGSTLAPAVDQYVLTDHFPVLQVTPHFQSTSVTSTKTGPTPHRDSSPICSHVRYHFHQDFPPESAAIFSRAFYGDRFEERGEPWPLCGHKAREVAPQCLTQPWIVSWKSVMEPMGEHFHARGYPLRVAHGSPVGLPSRGLISCPSSSS
jgi:hypothetical protein